jgi:hypothetical protein
LIEKRNIMKILSVLAVFFLVCNLLVCCVSPGASIALNDGPEDDKDYSTVLKESTRSAQIYDNFATRYHISATHLSPRFKTAFTQRLERLFTESSPSLDETGSRTGFFVSVFAPDSKVGDIDDPQLWKIFLIVDSENRQAPSLIKRLTPKDRWVPFFPSVTTWSKDFLIVFDTPNITPNATDLVEKKPLQLLFANSDARVHMDW